MKLLLIAPRGYCAGVAMAVHALEQALERFGPPVYVYHQIVHNRHVISEFVKLGAIFVDSIEDVPDGATLLYSAHGIAPAIREASAKKSLTVIDATCPLVLKVHNEAKRFARSGSTVLLIGHRGHDEVVGVQGEVGGKGIVIESVNDLDAVPADRAESIAYVTQTTLSTTETRDLIEQIRARFPRVQAPPKQDICYATTNRQEAVRATAPEAQLAIVIGSSNSSNTLRLIETARQCGVVARRIDSAEELAFEWFEGISTCILTAGASVPEVLIRDTIDAIASRVTIELEERAIFTETLRFEPPAGLIPRVASY